MRSMAVINQKGGCGKSITAINLSAFLAREQRRVLLIDLDPQGHATLGLQPDCRQPDRTVSDVIMRGVNREPRLSDVALSVRENLDLVPADIRLSAVPEKLSGVFGRESRLADALAEIAGLYHYIIVDCPPNIGLLTFNALMACSEAIIPIDPSFFSLHGIARLLETLEVLSSTTGHQIAPRALVTLYARRAEFSREVAEDVRKHMGDRVFDTTIRFSIKLGEAASRGLPISEYCHRCVGYEDYRALAIEVLRQEAGMQAFETLEKVEQNGDGLLEGSRTPSAPMATKGGVLFTLHAPEAHHVQLAGDFNGWAPDGNEMEFSSGVWRKMLSLAPGRYRYRYVVDGHWQSDPMNSHVEPSPYGEYDSVIELGEERQSR